MDDPALAWDAARWVQRYFAGGSVEDGALQLQVYRAAQRVTCAAINRRGYMTTTILGHSSHIPLVPPPSESLEPPELDQPELSLS